LSSCARPPPTTGPKSSPKSSAPSSNIR
jgi:hypothetical protein